MLPYQNDIETVCRNFETNLKAGLTTQDAKERLKAHGPNIIKDAKPKSPFVILLQQFLSPLMYILLIAAVASLFIGEFKDAIVISIAVIINSIIGFIQEWKAEKAVTTLKAYEVPRCHVQRDGKIFEIDARELVPGDIVLLAAGSRVPADIRLTYTADFTVEEAILTGESQAIKKNTTTLHKDLSLGDRTNMAFSGTYAIRGKAQGIIVATGLKTELGRIAKLIIETKEEDTPLQIQIKRFSWFLGWLMLSITSGVFLLGLFKQFPVTQIIAISIALAVAAIPEGLLVAVTVVLAIGMQRMLKRKALVRHIIAAETLGSVSVICTDKTGTLTKGHMAVDHIVTTSHDVPMMLPKKIPQEVYKLLEAAALNNDAQIVPEKNQRIGNPTEIALLEAANQNNIHIKDLHQKIPRINEIPFSSDIKYMATLHQINTIQHLIVKGAPEKIFPMCSLEPQIKERFTAKAHEMEQRGLRVLAFGYKEGKFGDIKNELHSLTCLGLVGLHDPLRPTAAQTVKELTNAGIHTVVVTGDHKDTAIHIAQGAGISIRQNNVMTGTQLDQISDNDLYNRIASIDLFARVDPQHKIRIVLAWQKRGESVAMIGDGVNDAPALKSADIGVALGSGSDVSHEISDMVLLDNNLSTISAAVCQGRIIFDNIRKIIVYLMADSFSEIILILGAMLMNLPLPIIASQIFWINLVTDGFPNLALTIEPGESQVITEKPRSKDEPIMNTQMKTLIFIIGIITDLGLFALFLGLLHTGFDLPHIRTIMFTALAIDSLFYVFSVRSMRTSLFRVNPFKNKWLNLSILAGAAIQLAAIYIPPMQKLFSTVSLGLVEWGIILALSLVKITGIEITKEFFLWKKNKAI